MKQTIKFILAVTIFCFTSFYSLGQDEPPFNTRWVSAKGYWVLEENIHKPTEQVIRFYNNDNLLLYQETLTNMKMNVAKRRIKMKLKKLLESTITTWEQNKIVRQNQNYVSMILK